MRGAWLRAGHHTVYGVGVSFSLLGGMTSAPVCIATAGRSPVVVQRRFEVVGAGWFSVYVPSFVVDFVVAAGAE